MDNPLSIFERFQSLFSDLSTRHVSERDTALGKIAATLILAEEIHKLSTTGVGIQQAETDLATAVTNLGTVITNAVAQIQSGDPALVAQAASTMETVAGELNTMGQQLSGAATPPVTTPAGGPAATGTAPTS